MGHGYWIYWFINNGLFFKKNIKCVGFDINKEKVRKINSGIIPLKDLEKWFGFNIKKMVKIKIKMVIYKLLQILMI